MEEKAGEASSPDAEIPLSRSPSMKACVFPVLACLLACLLLSAPAAAADGANGLRYFTQPENAAVSSTPYGDNPSAARSVQAGDAKIYYEVYGEGAPLLVLHGGGVGSPYELGCLLDKLRKDFRLVVVSTRGHGHSEMGHSPLSYEQKAEDVLAVMRQELGEGAAAGLGFSDGAYPAGQLAAMRPERVERVAAIGAGTLKPGYYSPEMPVEALERVDRAYVDQMRRLAPEPERLQEFFTAYMTFWSRMEVGRELLGAISCPVLLMTGDEDDHAPVLSVLEAHQMIPNSRLCVVPKAWHTAFLDNFPVVWEALSQFLHADPKGLEPSKKLGQNDIGEVR